MKNLTLDRVTLKEDPFYNKPSNSHTTTDVVQKDTTRKFSGDIVSVRNGSATQQQLQIKNQITLETLAANFVSSHVRSYCNDIATNFLELPEIQIVTPDSGKDVHSPITDLILPKLIPSANSGFAAVVMADVSGYSKLSSKLAEIGAQGAELLGKAMKGYLDQIIDIILQHGGDIVKFAGDAVIIYWKLPKATLTILEDDEEEDTYRTNADADLLKGDIVYKASLCCLELLKNLGSYNIEIPECEIKVLKIHLGIGAGLIYDVHVGHMDRWEHFIAGDGVNQLATVLDLAKSGELALSHSALKYLSMVIDIASVTIGNYDKRCIILTGLENAKRKDGTLNTIIRLNKAEKSPPKVGDVNKIHKIQEITDELIKQFINQSALFKLQMDLNQSSVFRMEAGVEELMKLNELRQVTTVFIKIGSIVVPDPKVMLDTAQEVISIVESTCRKFEGSMRQFHVDDKGAVILIFFGLPPLAHTNDVTYAMKAAIKIKERFEKQFDNFSIGLTTGAVSIGAVGNPQRTEYALMGDSINMAARLMCQPDAKKNVLCDVTSYKMSENDFVFEDRGEVLVKGKDKPIAIYRPQKLKSSGQKKGAVEAVHVVGRKFERKEITKVLTANSKGKSDKLMIFEAEGGQGLTTLFEFCKNEALQHDNQVFFAVGSELERRNQFFTIRQIFLDILYTFSGKGQNSEDSNSLLQNWKGMRVLKKAESNEANDSLSNIAIDEFKVQSFSSMPRKVSHTTRFMSPTKNHKICSPSSDVLNIASGAHSSPYVGGYYDKTKNRQSGLNVFKSNDSLEEKIAEMFISMKEPTDNIPLMNILFPNQFIENDTTSMIKGKLRIKELSKIFCRIINHMCLTNPIVLQISEGQWVDLASWGLLYDIRLTCPDLLLMIFSKPDTHYESEETGSVYSLIKRLPHARVLVLEGLSIEETSDLVLYLWDKDASEGLTKVDKVLLEQIHKKTNGVPLIIESLVLILKESGACGAKETGALFLSKKDFDFNQNIIMGDSLTNLIVAQLDRIDRGFQLFLKVASVLGQRFRLADVIFFLSDTPGILEKLGYDRDTPDLNPIKALDKYSYLQHIEDDSDFVLAFKSDLVRRCVYSTMVVSQRQQLHLYVASYFETMLNDSNKSRLLVQIHEHYTHTNNKNIGKKLMYLAAVSHYYYEENMMFEAIKHYNLLIRTEEECRKSSDPNVNKEVYDDHIRANWHLELGDAYYAKSEYKLCEENMRKTLTISGYTFPTKDSMFTLLNWRSLFTRPVGWKRSMSKEQQDKNKAMLIEISGHPGEDVKHTISSMGNESYSKNDSKGSKDMKSKRAASGSLPTSSALGNQKYVDLEQQAINENPEIQKKYTIRKALMVLAHILFRAGRYVAHNYAVDMAIKFSAGFLPDSFYGRLSSMQAHSTWLNKRDISGTLTQTLLALRLDEKDNVANTIRIVEHTALTLFWMGQWNACIKFTNSLQHLGAISTNAGHSVDALRLKSFMSLMFGSRTESLLTAKELFTISTSLDDWEGKITSAQIILVNMLLSSPSTFEVVENKILLKKLWGQSPALLKSDNYMALIQTTVTAAAELRTDPSAFRLLEYLHDVDFTIERLVVQGTSKVIVVSKISLGNTRVWVSVLGIMVFCHTIMVLYQRGNPFTNEEKTQIVKVTKKSIKYLRKSYEMRFFFLARCLKYKLRAVIALFDQDFPFKSVKAWEMSISLCGSNANLMSGIIHIWLSKFGQPSDSKRHLKEAEKLLKSMGSAFELEKRTA